MTSTNTDLLVTAAATVVIAATGVVGVVQNRQKKVDRKAGPSPEAAPAPDEHINAGFFKVLGDLDEVTINILWLALWALLWALAAWLLILVADIRAVTAADLIERLAILALPLAVAIRSVFSQFREVWNMWGLLEPVEYIYIFACFVIVILALVIDLSLVHATSLASLLANTKH